MATLASKLPAFQAALVAALRARPGIATPPGGLPPVQVSSGSLAPDDTAAETIFLLDASGDQDWAVVRAAAGNRHDETARQRLAVWVTRPAGGEQVVVAVRDRAFAIAGEVADQLDGDPTVTSTVRNARVARWEYRQGALPETGRWAELKLEVAWAARL